MLGPFAEQYRIHDCPVYGHLYSCRHERDIVASRTSQFDCLSYTGSTYLRSTGAWTGTPELEHERKSRAAQFHNSDGARTTSIWRRTVSVPYRSQ
jgi:hypothetical protein